MPSNAPLILSAANQANATDTKTAKYTSNLAPSPTLASESGNAEIGAHAAIVTAVWGFVSQTINPLTSVCTNRMNRGFPAVTPSQPLAAGSFNCGAFAGTGGARTEGRQGGREGWWGG